MFDSAAAIRFIERDSHRCGRRVSVLVEIYEEAIERNFQSIGNAFDDAQVCLMRNHASDVVRGETGIGENLLRRSHHRRDRLLVNFFAEHVNGIQVHVDVVARDRTPRAAAGHEQNVGELSVAADVRADNAVCAAAMLQHRRASSIAEKDTSVAIGPVRDRR